MKKKDQPEWMTDGRSAVHSPNHSISICFAHGVVCM
jgi:hypothetical protein